MKVTLRMIAGRAGVTCATASLALRNDPQISESRRAQIRRVADELGYRPNALVSTLMSHIRQAKPPPRHTSLLYLLTGPSASTGHPGSTADLCFRGAREQAARQGFSLAPFWLRAPGLKEERIDKILRARGVPGVIVGPREDAAPLPRLPWERLAAVMVSQSFSSPQLDQVSPDFYGAVRIAMDKLGRDSSGAVTRLILPETHDRNVRHLWTAGYLLERAGRRRFQPPLIVASAEPAIAWVRAHPGCVVLGTNLVLDWLRAARLAEARDFRFVSLNVEHLPEFTGILEPSLEVGAEAANLVISRIYLNQTGLPEKPRITLLEAAWQEGRPAAGEKAARRAARVRR